MTPPSAGRSDDPGSGRSVLPDGQKQPLTARDRHPDVGGDLHRDKMGKAAIKKPKNPKMPNKPKAAVRQQFGVLPYRENKKVGLEILLVSSRETGRWVVPKGWPIKGLKPAASAAREAYEEAGLRGAMRSRSLGSYLYEKRLVEKRTTVPCEVRLYSMQVTRQETTWPEHAERKRFWFSPTAAIAAVSEDGLKAIIGDFVSSRQKIDSSGSKAKTKRKRKNKR
jgi:8-oxo-dGTP pyrophosphatase MutT (NUDIX family)